MKLQGKTAVPALCVLGVGMAVGMAMGMGSSTAAAETRALAASGSWKAFGGTSNNGTGVCGISGSPGKRYFGLKQFADTDTFEVQMQMPQVTDKAQIPLTLKFDANGTWSATGYGFHFADGDPGINFPVNRSQADRFAHEFKSSSQLTIRFGSGGYQPWIMGLEGTMAVSNAFQNCMRALK